MEKKAHIYYNKENVLPDRTTRGELQMMRMLKIMFIILVGIGMLIMGIYEFIRGILTGINSIRYTKSI